MKKILVAYDGSPNSLNALDQAVDMARHYNAGMLIATVIPDVMHIIANETVKIPTEAKERSIKMVEDVVQSIRKDGIIADGMVLIGDIATKILKAAEENGCDLIVIGKRGLNNVDSFLIGSVTEKVVKHTNFSVWVVV